MDLKENIIKDYEIMSCSQLSIKYSLHKETIRKRLRSWGIATKHRMKPRVLHNYFKDIDTESKSYILGFLCADGSIYEKTNKISFCINTKDKIILEYVRKELNLNHKISDRIVYDKRTNKSYKQTTLQFSSKQIKNDLCNMGVCHDKSIILKFPKIPSNHIPHFIRGYFDGDGSITNKKCSVIGTKDFLLCWVNYFKQFGILWKNMQEVGGNQYKIYLQKTDDVILFSDIIYKDANIFLRRKYNKLIKVTKNIKTVMVHNVEINKNGVSKTFDSIKDAANYIGVTPSVVSNVLNGNNKTTKGYTIRSLGKRRINKDSKIGLDIDG